MMFVLVEKNELVNKNCSQGQELRTVQSLDGHLGMPIENGFKQVIEGFNGLRAQFVENTPNLNTSIGMRIFSASGSDQQAVITRTRLAQVRVVVMRITQHKTHLFGQLSQQQRWHCGSSGVGDSQLGCQWDPDRTNGNSQIQWRTIPPP